MKYSTNKWKTIFICAFQLLVSVNAEEEKANDTIRLCDYSSDCNQPNEFCDPLSKYCQNCRSICICKFRDYCSSNCKDYMHKINLSCISTSYTSNPLTKTHNRLQPTNAPTMTRVTSNIITAPEPQLSKANKQTIGGIEPLLLYWVVTASVLTIVLAVLVIYIGKKLHTRDFDNNRAVSSLENGGEKLIDKNAKVVVIVNKSGDPGQTLVETARESSSSEGSFD